MSVISAKDAAVLSRVSKLDWMTTDEAAIYCRVGVTTFERMVKDAPIPFSRPAGPNGDRRFYRPDLDATMRRSLTYPPPAA